ncbi:trichohyalin-plectin-homology domain domain-containing protein [Streptomyces sp. OspMP-M43]|uniref:trichohyalin-plectin-homology domain domain-containing protein n=1 Tax=Streptomyces sp. OspMP-M43 TaxID=1839781 RepID=UPI001EFC1DD8|nr:trichohyalin-plectin-homology domain domain-containing protein [Streptomyces sp. OspMP-M43]
MVKYAVSAPQAELLREIAAVSDAVRIAPGRTQVGWALEQRGLIKRTWRGSGHVAVVTADGRYYLKHGKHPRQVQAEKERLEGDSAQAALAPADGAELVSRLQSASGTVTVADPAPRTRGRWRAAYYDALHHGHVPEGHKVRWNGRQRGDCVFTLVNEEAEKAAQPAPVPRIDVPEVLDRPHPLVRATRKAMGRSQGTVDTRGRAGAIPLHVSRPLADRALRIMHALLAEAESRGYTAEPQTDLHRGEAVHTLAIVIRGRSFPLVLTERTTKIPHEPTPKEVRQRERNPWIRLPKYDEEFNGRLGLGAPAKSRYQHSYAHSDGARWTLESRLGHLLQDLERLAAEGERRDREQELLEAERRRRWYAAIAQAREQQIDQQRAKALAEQMTAWNQAAEIRAFCQAARARTDSAPLPAGEAEWLQWAEAYAARLDPLHHALVTPPDPPARPEVLRELAKVDVYAYPWPFDADGRWVLPQ